MKLPLRPVVDVRLLVTPFTFRYHTRTPLDPGYSSGALPGAKMSDAKRHLQSLGRRSPTVLHILLHATAHQGRAWQGICGRRVFN
ncbi:hypothetical protein BV22DRAFT_19192 [Leucogyrophana mollusca]|uniref:Uncharacterized protein n=1 Tax=Leucogyrophana mollusca TaxID=85980 RepID=A0ACB8C0D0_9AGAM|nr:hypothetical protein BV22DRAFT_19192 [Leucogyrophana mollusca]